MSVIHEPVVLERQETAWYGPVWRAWIEWPAGVQNLLGAFGTEEEASEAERDAVVRFVKGWRP